MVPGFGYVPVDCYEDTGTFDIYDALRSTTGPWLGTIDRFTIHNARPYREPLPPKNWRPWHEVEPRRPEPPQPVLAPPAEAIRRPQHLGLPAVERRRERRARWLREMDS